ncbi:MAG TPA: 2-C-methyl-D-erythritol 4-phosphate cytidylyltransferase [Thermoanaerobacterales bacterium]|nr:2-C-methyl-D-erythritol 4-phosphate cytidylyltransferase [Thermoanaerobacterales bacterium]
MRVSAVIAAGGRGKRMNSSTSKQFLNLKGHPIIYYTLKTFYTMDAIDEIILVVGKYDMECTRAILDRYRFNKIKLVEGGSERRDSVYNGLRQLSPQTDIVAIHDGVRPFIKKRVIMESIEEAKKYGAVGVAVPVKDTIKVVGENNIIKYTPERKTLWGMQTPQTFKYEIIMEAHEKARLEGVYGTDDAVLVERIGLPVKIIQGGYENIKITTPEDIVIAESFVTMGYGDFWR